MQNYTWQDFHINSLAPIVFMLSFVQIRGFLFFWWKSSLLTGEHPMLLHCWIPAWPNHHKTAFPSQLVLLIRVWQRWAGHTYSPQWQPGSLVGTVLFASVDLWPCQRTFSEPAPRTGWVRIPGPGPPRRPARCNPALGSEPHWWTWGTDCGPLRN